MILRLCLYSPPQFPRRQNPGADDFRVVCMLLLSLVDLDPRGARCTQQPPEVAQEPSCEVTHSAGWCAEATPTPCGEGYHGYHLQSKLLVCRSDYQAEPDNAPPPGIELGSRVPEPVAEPTEPNRSVNPKPTWCDV